MKKIDEVFQYMIKHFSADEFSKAIISGNSAGFEATDIGSNLNITRNNASAILNRLVDEKKLVKILGRPVRFIPMKEAQRLFIHEEVRSEYTMEQLQGLVKLSIEKNKDPFTRLIGYNGSLKYCIEQAKAAVMYPPSGLHTLLLGASGVGKTLFANVMYQYAKMCKNKTETDFPFVSFNCSDYFNNPQLLLSHLFGHVRGAFTGADKDRSGLVEKANGGILFLDEIHRLSPDGQEMLFTLMDKGEYYRLGETDRPRKSEVLLIAATTENPYDVLLRTFLRRIPVMITLPSLNDRSMDERLKIIEQLFANESMRIKRRLQISSEVLKALAIYDCRGNIGQMESDIKQICARAFLQQINEKDQLMIGFSVLPVYIKDSIFNMEKIDQNKREYLNFLDDDLVVLPSSADANYKVPKDNIYTDLTHINEQMQKKGMSQEQINVAISQQVDKYIRNVLTKFDGGSNKEGNLYKIIDKPIVDFTFQMIDSASEALGRELNPRISWVLAFHFNFLIMRSIAGDSSPAPKLTEVQNKYPKEYHAAEIIADKFEKTFGIPIVSEEKDFLAILLANENVEHSPKETVGIIILAHGKSTASSIATFSNELLKTNLIRAIDMPLEEEVEKTYQRTLSMAKSINNGQGILLLVDMGSLMNFGSRITEETGIMTRTIDRVSTPLVLEALRRVLYKGDDLDTVFTAINQYFYMPSPKNWVSKPKAIITTCSTGKGTSLMLQQLMQNLLAKKGMSEIQVISIDYMSLRNKEPIYQSTVQKYDVIACIGNMNPDIGVVFFDMEEIINEQSRETINKFLDNFRTLPLKESAYDEVERLLENRTLFLNVKLAVKNLKAYFENLKKIMEKTFSDAVIIKCSIHIAYMLERLITGQIIKFDDKESYIKENPDMLQKLKLSMTSLEKIYHIHVTDDELCYLSQIFMNLNKLG